MSSDAKDLVVVPQPPAEEQPPPPPPRAAPRAPEPDFVDRALLYVEARPLLTALWIFIALTALHVILLNLAGVASWLSAGGRFVLLSAPVEVTLLAFIAYSIVLPTLMGRACVRAYDALRPSLMLDDRSYGELRAGIVDPFVHTRAWAGALWAALLTPVFGDVFHDKVPGEDAGKALLTIWMYVRIAVTFGLLGANVAYVVRVLVRFRDVTAEHLRVDLFDQSPMQPVARFAGEVALYLAALLALAGPAVAEPDAAVQSAAMLAAGLVMIAVATVAAMSGARRSIRTAKQTAIGEVSAYARELWRRAYAGQRLVEAVAVTALSAMITARNELRRVPEWPGGWGVFLRFAALALVPLLTWFGAQLLPAALAAL